MTVLSAPSGKGRGPIEGEEPEHAARFLNAGPLTDEETRFFNSVKEWLGGDINERVLIQVIKSHAPQQNAHMRNNENLMNDLVSVYFDRLQQEAEKPSVKQVRFSERLEVPTPAHSTVGHHHTAYSSRGTSTEKLTDVVDLTGDEEKGAPKWTDAGSNVLGNREEQDMINRAIAESLKENQNIPGFAPCAQKDPENPHERAREGLTPVGLKNTGNTCWFNIIAQTLFHIPQFRQLLLDFQSPEQSRENQSAVGAAGHSSSKKVSLLMAFRRLAAFLIASSRAYVDPSYVLSVISDLNWNLNKGAPCMGVQQDATEMFLRLTEWLEEAFKNQTEVNGNISASVDVQMENVAPLLMDENVTPSGSRDEAQPNGNVERDDQMVVEDPAPSTPASSMPSTAHFHSNPFSALFHGSHIEFRQAADGSVSSKLENSLQLLNLDITYENLHDSLEAYHFSDSPGKEIWFETLPPVIVFSLVRFSYKNGQTEKVHSKFHFPCDFYMDRYMRVNRDYVAAKRRERAGLREKLDNVKARLQGYETFPVGSSHETLPNIINAVCQFISPSSKMGSVSSLTTNEPMEVCDGNGTAPSSSSATDLPVFGPHPKGEEKEIAKKNTVPPVYPILDKSLLSDCSVDDLSGILRKLADHAQRDVDELQEQANLLTEAVDKVFNVDGMMEESYRLHSVLIHEGEANVGHYWAYVADHATSNPDSSQIAWRKFNDRTVEPATWQQIEEDSYGSRKSCSAYCLVYTRKRCEEELFGRDSCSAATSIADLVALLPADLSKEVISDNRAFDDEIKKWDDAPTPLKPVRKLIPKPSQDRDLMSMVSHRDTLNMDSLTSRHYDHAYRYFASLIINNVCDSLRRGMTEVQFWDHEESVAKLLSEVLAKFSPLLENAITSGGLVKVADLRLILTEWANLWGIRMSYAAQQLFVIRVLMCSQKPRLVELCVAKADEVTDAGKMDSPDSVKEELEDVHLLYEMFCQTVAVISEILKKYESGKSQRVLKVDVNQVKLLCAAVRAIDKIHSFAEVNYYKDDGSPLDLLVNGLLIIYSIRITQELFDQIEADHGAGVLGENSSFLHREYKAILVRIKNSDMKAAKRTMNYITSVWDVLLSNSNGILNISEYYQIVVDAADQKTISEMPQISVNVQVVDTGADLHSLSNFTAKMNLKRKDDLNLLVDEAVSIGALSQQRAVNESIA